MQYNDLKNVIDFAVEDATEIIMKELEEERKQKEEAKIKLKDTAVFLKKSGMDLQEISNLTGLSLDELEKM